MAKHGNSRLAVWAKKGEARNLKAFVPLNYCNIDWCLFPKKAEVPSRPFCVAYGYFVRLRGKCNLYGFKELGPPEAKFGAEVNYSISLNMELAPEFQYLNDGIAH